MAAPGWYRHEDDPPGSVRYWNGEYWDAAGTSPAAPRRTDPPRTRRRIMARTLIGVALAVAVMVGGTFAYGRWNGNESAPTVAKAEPIPEGAINSLLAGKVPISMRSSVRQGCRISRTASDAYTAKCGSYSFAVSLSPPAVEPADDRTGTLWRAAER